MEVYSVDDVVSVDPVAGTTSEYYPFYSFHHGMTGEETKTFWYASRRPSLRTSDRGVKDRGTEVYLNLVDLNFDPSLPSDPTLVVRTTCTNRELPSILQQAGERLLFDLEAAAPLRADPPRTVTVEPVATTHESRDLLEPGFPPLSQPSLAGEFG